MKCTLTHRARNEITIEDVNRGEETLPQKVGNNPLIRHPLHADCKMITDALKREWKLNMAIVLWVATCDIRHVFRLQQGVFCARGVGRERERERERYDSKRK